MTFAVGVEVHNRENYKPDPTLDNVFVLMSAYQDGEFIVPVKLEVKKFKDKQNTLYVAISLEKIKKTEVSEQGNTDNGVTQGSHSVNLSIARIFAKINPADKNFLKYIPNGFLNNDQIAAKQDRSAYQSARDILLSYAEDARKMKAKATPMIADKKTATRKGGCFLFYIIEIMRFPS